jgi:hypothetical protein
MVGIVGGAFHSKTSCFCGTTLWNRQPSVPRDPSGMSRPNHSSSAPPGSGTTLTAFGAKKLSMPSVVVHAFHTSATGALITRVTHDVGLQRLRYERIRRNEHNAGKG